MMMTPATAVMMGELVKGTVLPGEHAERGVRDTTLTEDIFEDSDSNDDC
jgi:hypothetical protein